MLSTYMSSAHQHNNDLAASRHLLDNLHTGAGLSILTVDTGAPTAAVTQTLVHALPPERRVAVIAAPRQSLMGFLHAVCVAFGAPVPLENHSIPVFVAALREFLERHRASLPLLVLDEAQTAPFYVLWQLLPLIEPDDEGQRSLQVLLVGRPSLHELLARPELAPVIARVDAECQLTDWPEEPAAVPVAADTASVLSPAPTLPVPSPAPLLVALPPARRRRLPWLMAACLAGGAVALVMWMQGGAPDAVRTPPVAVSATPPPVAAAPVSAPAEMPTTAPVVATAPTPPAPESATAAPRPPFGELVDDAESTWGTLARQWNAQLSVKAPCEAALAQQLQCYRRPDMTPALLRQLDRPGLVQMKADGVVRWVHLRSMDDGQVTLFSSGKTWTQPLAEFTAQWTGAYSTLWRLPPGQNSQVFTAVPASPAGQWLDQQLKALQAGGRLAPTADTLEARVRELQRSHQWPVDGTALPTVLLLVNRMVDVPEPRLVAMPTPVSR